MVPRVNSNKAALSVSRIVKQLDVFPTPGTASTGSAIKLSMTQDRGAGVSAPQSATSALTSFCSEQEKGVGG
jgi:hypothetical protein